MILHQDHRQQMKVGLQKPLLDIQVQCLKPIVWARNISQGTIHLRNNFRKSFCETSAEVALKLKWPSCIHLSFLHLKSLIKHLNLF